MSDYPRALVPTKHQVIALNISVSIFTATAAVIGYLVYFLQRTCQYQEPYTLHGCITDLLAYNRYEVLLWVVAANVVFYAAMHFYYRWALEEWRGKKTEGYKLCFSAAMWMLIVGLLVWALVWPLTEVFRVFYVLGTDADYKQLFAAQRGGYVPLFQQAVSNMVVHPVLYLVAGFFGGLLHWQGLEWIERWARRKG